MGDRTLIICASLVIIAALFFAGAGVLFMMNGNPGDHSGGSFQMNDKNRNSAPPCMQSETNGGPDVHQGKGSLRPGSSSGKAEPGRGECSSRNQGDREHFSPDSMNCQKHENQRNEGNEGMTKGHDINGYQNPGKQYSNQDRSDRDNQTVQGSNQKEQPGEPRDFRSTDQVEPGPSRS